MKKIFYLCLLIISLISSCTKNDKSPIVVSPMIIVFQDSLSVYDNGWLVDSTSAEVHKFYGGHYVMRLDTIGRLLYSLAPYATLNFPYSLQVDATIQLDLSSQQGCIGLIFNYVDPNDYYILEVYNYGDYRIWQRLKGSTVILNNSTYSTAINIGSGFKNTIKINQDSTSLKLSINNAPIGTFAIPLINSYTRVGLVIGTGVPSAYYTPMDGLFNNFSITKL